MSLTFEIEAWPFDLDEDCGPIFLNSEEAGRVKNISNSLLRKRYQRTRSRVRQVLANRLNIPPQEIEIKIAPGGKPHLTLFPGVHFSISHSRNLLLVALCDAPIGVDIEIPRARENALAMAERFFSIPDFELLKQAAPATQGAAFLRQWVAKEAALKAVGFGITDVLREARCHFSGERIHSVAWAEHEVAIEPFDLPGGATGAFAWLGDRSAVIHWHDAGKLKGVS